MPIFTIRPIRLIYCVGLILLTGALYDVGPAILVALGMFDIKLRPR